VDTWLGNLHRKHDEQRSCANATTHTDTQTQNAYESYLFLDVNFPSYCLHRFKEENKLNHFLRHEHCRPGSCRESIMDVIYIYVCTCIWLAHVLQRKNFKVRSEYQYYKHIIQMKILFLPACMVKYVA